ncbi:MAG: thiopurine S-methyltransferase [Deltaproteobacteria bacterium]|nr:MAG: thiopurine S-methyltransferase [Deltaproteobacteria bacterium]TMQ16131.1 MAG: thiopurine S-methyltransferase [Deltaproteobacteria bacterium]
MEDWIARWREGRIGFHEGRPNRLLECCVARLADCRRVLVPLCGKAEDLAFLAAHGHDVLGVELAEQAVRGFFDEHGLVPSIAPHGPYTAYHAGAITLLAGDVFALTPELVAPIDALYDRGALIALPAELRPRYVALLGAVLPEAAPGLVVTVEYDPRAMAGPPFPVPEAELRALYAGATIELLGEQPVTTGKCAQLGVSAIERCFAIRPIRRSS